MDGLWLENGPFRLDEHGRVKVNPYRRDLYNHTRTNKRGGFSGRFSRRSLQHRAVAVPYLTGSGQYNFPVFRTVASECCSRCSRPPTVAPAFAS